MENRYHAGTKVELLSLELRRPRPDEAGLIHSMQVRAFTPLMETWQDYQTSPAKETLEGIQAKLGNPDSDYWFMACGSLVAGVIRVVRKESGRTCRVSPVFVLPEYQGQGIARTALLMAERLYPQARVWELETIAQDTKLCSFYQSLGYRPTGETRPLRPGLNLAGFRKET